MTRAQKLRYAKFKTGDRVRWRATGPSGAYSHERIIREGVVAHQTRRRVAIDVEIDGQIVRRYASPDAVDLINETEGEK